jgi:hypothetical protein
MTQKPSGRQFSAKAFAVETARVAGEALPGEGLVVLAAAQMEIGRNVDAAPTREMLEVGEGAGGLEPART